MRRNDYDVSNSIRTTDSAAVAAEVIRLFKGLYAVAAPELERAFADISAMYVGTHPDYHPCDTEYHDLQHVLDVTLAMARLMDGYQGSRRTGEAAIPRELFIVGVLAALFHDFGYLRRRRDHRHRYGAEYTLTHVSRGAQFLRGYLRELGLGHLAGIAGTLVHYTGYERPTESIRISDTLLRRVGHMLGTADIIAQMSDRCYLEKCRDRLYPEFVLGRVAGDRYKRRRQLPAFASGDELVQRTPAFYQGAVRRLDVQLARAYDYAAHHFGGENLYLSEMQKNIQHAERVARLADSRDGLRRQPPSTLADGAEPYPKDLLRRP